jgi:nucleotide-binding universal stress UspA family protein
VICVGAVGLDHFARGRVGSTAAALATSAHCTVAIIRRNDGVTSAKPDAILVYVGTSPDDDAVLQAAVDEALVRGTRLHAVTAWQSRFSDTHDSQAVADGNRRVHAQLDRRLERCSQCHPDLEVTSAAVHGSFLDHLAKIADSIELVVMGTHDHDVAQLVGPAGNAVLQSTDCSVLIVGRQHL